MFVAYSLPIEGLNLEFKRSVIILARPADTYGQCILYVVEAVSELHGVQLVTFAIELYKFYLDFSVHW